MIFPKLTLIANSITNLQVLYDAELESLLNYADKPDANQKAVQIRLAKLEKIFNELETLKSLNHGLQEDIIAAINHARQESRQDKKQKTFYNRLDSDNEQNRINSIDTAQNKWPELF